jgi:hypothetical protein
MFTKERLIELHADTFKKTREILIQKNNDYSGGHASVDPFANFRSAEFFGVAPELGLMLRMGDKLARVKTFVRDGELKVTGESVMDACDDLVNYAILLKGLLIERRETVEARTPLTEESPPP